MNQKPFFSVIVPTYNRPEPLGRCLEALAQQEYPRDQFEVIVVDDGGTKPLGELLARFQEQIQIQHIVQPNLGPAVARNNGARQAHGRFFAFTDDDCAPAPAWLPHLAEQLMKEPQKMVGGYTRNALSRNPFSITSQLLIDFLYHHYNKTESRALFFTSNNIAIAADLFWKIGGFDETMPLAAGEDRELCDRWLEEGYEMVYLPKAVIFHEHYLQFFSFWRQHFNYGRGAWLYHWVRSQRKHQPVHLESPSFYLKLVSFPLTMARDIRAYILTVMLFFTQAANAVGFLYERLTQRYQRKKKLPLREPHR